MSTNLVETMEIGALPFFARFLEEQAHQSAEPEPEKDDKDKDTPSFPPIYTFKYPSDWEDV